MRFVQFVYQKDFIWALKINFWPEIQNLFLKFILGNTEFCETYLNIVT